MSGIDTEDLPGASAPILSAALLARIHELNLEYLELLAAERALVQEAGQLQHLPGKLHAAIAALSPSARSSLAAIPYALYSLGFEDDAFWRAACEPSVVRSATSVAERYAPARSARLYTPFAELALLYAWHVATSNKLASRVVYAMPDGTALRLTAVPLWHIRRIAAEHPALLMPRWPTNRGFWPDLVRFAAAEDAQRLGTAKLLGHQLIAAELEASVTREARGAAAPALSLQSPRLRARRLRLQLRRGVLGR